MNEKKYEKRLETQNKIISRQSGQIEELELQISKLKLDIEEKNKIINSINPLREKLLRDIDEVQSSKKEFDKLIDELKKMKNIMNQEVYKGKWKLIKFLIK